jgi:hypothetical protein
MVRLLHLRQRDGDTLHEALKARMADLPATLRRSITCDQGAEMARHLKIARSLGAPVYFCAPARRGSAAPMRTATGSCATTSRKAPTSQCRNTDGFWEVISAAKMMIA